MFDEGIPRMGIHRYCLIRPTIRFVSVGEIGDLSECSMTCSLGGDILAGGYICVAVMLAVYYFIGEM